MQDVNAVSNEIWFAPFCEHSFFIRNHLSNIQEVFAEVFDRFGERNAKGVSEWSNLRLEKHVSSKTVDGIAEKFAELKMSNVDFPGMEGVFQAWNKEDRLCESLTLSGSEPMTQCYSGPLDGRLLTQRCNVEFIQNTIPATPTHSFDSYLKGAGYLIGAIAVAKTMQNLWNGNKKYALGWAVVGAVAFTLPNINFR